MTGMQIRLRVPELMEEKGWGPMDLVRKLEFAPATAYRLARGEANSVSMETLNRLCEGFGVSIDELLVRETVAVSRLGDKTIPHVKVEDLPEPI